MTVLFCDVTGSTALGERIDPESLRRVMARYFETAEGDRRAPRRHRREVHRRRGHGRLRRPGVHEDDALRAVRAADELRGGLAELNDELERELRHPPRAAHGRQHRRGRHRHRGAARDGRRRQRRRAARAGGAARRGAARRGDPRPRARRRRGRAGRAAGRQGQGRAGARLPPRRPSGATRRGGTARAMVGRERQRKLLDDAFANVVSERSCHLFTILGTAGVGKSRLVEEFLRVAWTRRPSLGAAASPTARGSATGR